MRRIAVITTLISLAMPTLAGAHAPSLGGTEVPGQPTITAVDCSDGTAAECVRGAKLRIVGENLNGVERVRFLGGPGRADDRVARPQETTPHELSVVVPRQTRTGPVEVRSWTGSARVASVRISKGARRVVGQGLADAPTAEAVFPIRGDHEYGGSTGRFGGGRGHQGQDVFAKCGTPLVAAMAGRVIKAAFQSRAGNYAVIQHTDGRSTAYMHLRRPATVTVGDQVQAGAPIGEVGETGRASGCHLHFELWTAPGWYRGGRPIDPLATLRAIDKN